MKGGVGTQKVQKAYKIVQSHSRAPQVTYISSSNSAKTS